MYCKGREKASTEVYTEMILGSESVGGMFRAGD